jgi:RNA polymerase sigma factor (sigma-70 family)
MATEKEFIKLLNKHQNIIHKVCRLYMDKADEREDLFQEVTLQAWKAFASFRGDAQFSTWLYRVALNTAITFYRKEKKQPPVFNTEIFPDSSETYNPIEEQVQAMYQALVMLYLEDYDYKTIGEMLGISPNNVAVKMNRVKVKLKEETQKHYQFT